MEKHELRRSYRQLSDPKLGDFGINVGTQMIGNLFFKIPKVKPEDIITAANNLIAGVAACLDGTRQDTIKKNNLRAILISLLDQNALDIEATAMNNKEALASTGYLVMTTGARTTAPVGPAVLDGVEGAGTGAVLISLVSYGSIWGVEVEIATANGPWTHAGYFTDIRNVKISNLTPGQTYTFRIRVHGSRNQISDWSDAVSHMAI